MLLLAVLTAALVPAGAAAEFVTPPMDCLTEIIRNLGWVRIEMQFRPEDTDFSPSPWLRHFSDGGLFVHPKRYGSSTGLPAESDGGLLFGPHPLGLPHGDHHWIHVVGDPRWRPVNGPAGWVSWLYRGDAGWRMDTLRWTPARHEWMVASIGVCGEAGFVEDRPGEINQAVNVGDWTLHNVMRGQHLRLGFAAAGGGSDSGLVRSAGYEDGLMVQDGELLPGPQADLIRTMSTALGFSYSVMPVFAAGNRSAWARLVDEVASYRLDIGLSLFSPTPELRGRVQLLYPLYYVTTYGTVRRPRLSSAGFDPSQPFSATSWWAILAFLLLAVACWWLTEWLVRRYRGPPGPPGIGGALQQFSSHALQVVGIACGQGVELSVSAASMATLFLSLRVFAMLIYNFYTGVMLSYMAVLVPSAPFASLADAVARGFRFRYQVGSREENLLRSNSSALIGAMLANSAPIAYSGPEEGFPAAALAATTAHDVILAKDTFLAMDPDFADPASSPLCFWPESVVRTPMGMIAQPHLPNPWMVSRYLRVMEEVGILSRWRQRLQRAHLAGSRLCSVEPETASYSQLGLDSVAACFIQLLAAMALALLIMAAEVLVHRLSRPRGPGRGRGERERRYTW